MIRQNKDIKPYPQPENIPLPQGNYMLTESFVYVWRAVGSGAFKIIVPRGFKYDGASVPRALWSILGVSKDGIHRAAATVHDFLYSRKGAVHGSRYARSRWRTCRFKITRKQADVKFYQMLRDSGVGRVRAKAMYWAVRVFGGSSWKK